MKRIIYIAATLLAITACSGTIDPEENSGAGNGNTENSGNGGNENQGGNENTEPQIPDEFTAPFTLSADKTEVEADGTDAVTFSLKDKYGREMLDDKKTLQDINITSDGVVRVPRMEKSVAFIGNGIYTFKARYNGVNSENTVEITAVNRARYEVFHKNVGLFKSTSVWCVACPKLAANLHGLSEDTKDRTVVLAFHGDFNYKDPFSLYAGNVDLGTYLMSYFEGSGWPTLVYDLDEAKTGSAGTAVLEDNIYGRRLEHPATCGIKVSSVAVEGTELKVKASLKTSTGGDYDLACAVLMDGLGPVADGYSLNGDGMYDEVVLNVSQNFLRYDFDTAKSLKKDGEMEREFAFDFGEGNVPAGDVLKKYYVAVWAHKKTDGKSVMDNIVKCSYGGTADYRYNE